MSEKKVRFSISMEKELLDMLDNEAKINRWSRVTMINWIVEDYFELYKRQKAFQLEGVKRGV